MTRGSDLDEVVLFSGRDGESANVVAVDDVIEKLLADGGQQQLLPNPRLKQAIGILMAT